VLDDATAVLVSEVVEFLAEFRCFLAAGEVRAVSRYAVAGELDVAAAGEDPRCADAAGFARLVGDDGCPALPSAVVVDVGLVADPVTGRPEWAVIEANAAWASGHYAADADAALDVVLRSSRPLAEIDPGDRPFLRRLPTVTR
jgi:hypothetical protein